MNHQELIETASKDEWTLECDKKMLDMMQNIASKIENRATNTKSKMNTMILNLDETKVKMSNLTRINDVKNAVFCENLITDDHLESINEVPKTDTVKLLSPQIAIENGLKLMNSRFEQHRVNLDPSKSRNETLVYRPIDKFYSPLPYLIGSDKWKDKWHLGLIEEDKVSQTGSRSSYAESVESNVTQNAESNLVAGSSLMASNDSLAKSTSSIGDQMIINKPTGLFDEVDDEEPKETATTSQPTTSSFFRPQPAERKIVNLFDDEPPELDDSSYNRKPVNLFEDDYDSVASFPIEEKVDKPQFQQPPPPPVDLFNENEFDDFIKRMENNRNSQPEPSETIVKEKATAGESSGMQRDMKKIADEIKKVQLKKRSDEDVVKKSEVVKPKEQVVKQPEKIQLPKPMENHQKDLPKSTPQPQVQQNIEPPPIQSQPAVKPRSKIANLFDDDEEDFFSEIMKQKTAQTKPIETVTPQREPVVAKIIPEKKKITNLFDDEDDNDEFEDIFNKKSIAVSTPKKIEQSKLFDDRKSGLFDDLPGFSDAKVIKNPDDDGRRQTEKPAEDIFSKKPEKVKTEVPEAKKINLFDDLPSSSATKSIANQGNDKQRQTDKPSKEILSKNPEDGKIEPFKLFDDKKINLFDDQPVSSKVIKPVEDKKKQTDEPSKEISIKKPLEVKAGQKNIPEAKKINLFDDLPSSSETKSIANPDNDESKKPFEDIFSKKPVKVKAEQQEVPKAKKINLFDDLPSSSATKSVAKIDDKKKPTEETAEIIQSPAKDYQPSSSSKSSTNDNASQLPVKSDNKNLFDDDDDEFSVSHNEKEERNMKITKEAENESESSKFERPLPIEIKQEETPDQTANLKIENDVKSNIEIKATEIHDKVPNMNIEKDDFNRSIPFLNDEPPDDEDTWDTEENNYEEPETKTPLNQSKSSFQMPLFDDDVPPDDEDFSAPPIPSFDDFEDDDDVVNEDLPAIPDEKSTDIVESTKLNDPFIDSLRKSIERSDFSDQWSDFKEKIKVKTEADQKPGKSTQKIKSESKSDQEPEKSTQKLDSESKIYQELKKSTQKLNLEAKIVAKDPQSSDSLSSSLQESNTSTDRSDSFDESDRSISNIKSKLDLFTKPQESPNSSQNELPKKLPGKLNTSLKINVNALMPGARLPVVKKEEIIEKKEDKEEPSSSSNSQSDNTNLLNNDATKMRAKIQVKRRPSTRVGRRSIYEKSLNEQLDEGEENKSNKDNNTIDKLAPEVNELPPSNLSISDNDKPHNKIMSIDETISDAKINFASDESPPSLEISSNIQGTVTNKIPVFYDDEYETKKMLEEQKAKENEKKKLFEDDEEIFGGKSNVKETNKPKKPLFGDDDSDEDIFKPTPVKEVQRPKEIKASKPLFGDDEDDDDLFGMSKSKSAKDEQKESKTISKPKGVKQQTKPSLFGDNDEEVDDDDLFSSKPKNVPNKSSMKSSSSSTATAKKSSSSFVNDPLKDLLDN